MSAALGLEVWLTGSPTDLDQAAAQLAVMGRIAERGERRALLGEDRGRYRQYLRISVGAQRSPR